MGHLRSALSIAAVVFATTIAAPASADEPGPEPTTDAPPPPPAPAAAPAEPVQMEIKPGKIPEGRIGTQKLLGAVAGALGFLTTAVGGFLVISSVNLYNEAEGRCHSHGCSANDVNDGKKARDRANVGGVVLVSGLAVLGGGIALWFTAPSKPGAKPEEKKTDVQVGLAPTLGPNLGALSAVGTF